MIFNPELVSAETQRRVFLCVVQAIVAMGNADRVEEGTTRRLELGATLDGLLEVIAALLAEADVLPDAAAEEQVCEDIRTALAAHIRQTRFELEAGLDSTRH